MTWFKVDDGFYRHRKVRKLGTDRVPAVGLWLLAGNWAADNTADGFVPFEILDGWDRGRRLTDRLVLVGLWELDVEDGEDGIRFHDWAVYQPTRELIEAEREKARQRMRRLRSGRTPGERSEDVRPNIEGTADEPPENFGRSSDSPSRPVPSRSSPDGELPPPDGGDARATREGPGAIRSDRDRTRRRSGRVAELAKTARSAHAHQLVEAYAATCKLRPGPRLLTTLGVEVDVLLARGWPPDVLADCIQTWAGKGLGPTAFQAVANEVANRGPARASPVRTSTTDQRVADAQALKERFRSVPDPGQVLDLRAIPGGTG